MKISLGTVLIGLGLMIPLFFLIGVYAVFGLVGLLIVFLLGGV